MLDRLTLDHLRILVAVAEEGSFSAAARRLRRVQSAVSQSIRGLEQTLDLTLFDRSAKIPTLTDAGRVLLEDARRLIAQAQALQARAERIASDIEPELTLAVDVMFPNALLMNSLKTLTQTFPDLPVTVFTEGLGGAEQRLRDGAARLGIYCPNPTGTEGLVSTFLADVTMAPVVAADHPLAKAKSPIDRATLEEHVQLVLTDRTQITARFSGGVVSRRVWRFADLGTRLEYLRAGFGWCNMPLHLVQADIDAGKLKRLRLTENNSWMLPIHVVHEHHHVLGRAGRWLIEDLRANMTSCPTGSAPPPARKGRTKKQPR